MDNHMKPKSILLLTLFLPLALYGQNKLASQPDMTIEQNLRSLVTPSLSGNTPSFDNRYQGVKGSPRLFDTLVSTSFLLRGGSEHITMACDIDVVRNSLVFIMGNPPDLLEISSDYIKEIVFHGDGRDMTFMTTRGLAFDREIKENRFYQVLKEGPWQFIKIPGREFIEADYKRLYSPDIRYDEYKPDDRYYIMGNDSVFHRVLLTRKSLVKLFPEKKSLIKSNFDENTGGDTEAAVTLLLEKF